MLFVNGETSSLKWSQPLVDYILVRKSDRVVVREIKVVRSEGYISQHKLKVCMLRLKARVLSFKEVFVS